MSGGAPESGGGPISGLGRKTQRRRDTGDRTGIELGVRDGGPGSRIGALKTRFYTLVDRSIYEVLPNEGG